LSTIVDPWVARQGGPPAQERSGLRHLQRDLLGAVTQPLAADLVEAELVVEEARGFVRGTTLYSQAMVAMPFERA
jgi:hypothetical protein